MVTKCVLRRKPTGGYLLEPYLVDPQTKTSSPESYSLPRWDGRSPKIHGCCAQYTMSRFPPHAIHSQERYGTPRKEFPHGDYRPRNTRPYRIWNLQDGNRALVAIVAIIHTKITNMMTNAMFWKPPTLVELHIVAHYKSSQRGIRKSWNILFGELFTARAKRLTIYIRPCGQLNSKCIHIGVHNVHPWEIRRQRNQCLL